MCNKSTLPQFVVFIFSQVTVNDTAKYVCKATNDFGEVVTSAFVDVRTRTKVLKGPEPALFQNGNLHF